jgi:uncharacterized protein YprB with RNaseH-like and TPR domain
MALDGGEHAKVVETLFEGGLPEPSSGLRLEQAMALGRMLKASDQWRLYRELRDQARYLDIETLGLAVEDPITLVGISDGAHTSVLVSGRDLSAWRLAEELADARLLVTFNGTSFDLPRLKRAFPTLPWDLPHLDLAIAGRHVGLRGGLKAIERRLGWRRPGLPATNGADAVRLWQRHLAGERQAVPRLVRYCRADVACLPALAEVVVERLADEALADPQAGWIRPAQERELLVARTPGGVRPA